MIRTPAAGYAAMMACTLAALAAPASGYEIGTAVSSPCHESMTAIATAVLLAEHPSLFPESAVPVPESEEWSAVLDLFADDVENVPVDEAGRFILLSLLLGTRYPDTAGGSVTDISGLHRIHDDPATQSHHCIRSVGDDGEQGNLEAIESCLAFLREELALARTALEDSTGQIGRTPYYDDFYGALDVEVWLPAFHLGIALHTVQDSFSHMIRSDDLTMVRHVMNYLEATTYDYDSTRDGLPHSLGMDDCEGPGKPIFEAGARPASLAFMRAAVEDGAAVGLPATEAFFAQWMAYEPGCEAANDFCDSKWLSAAQSEPSEPYLSCDLAGGEVPWPESLALLSLGMGCLVLLRTCPPLPRLRGRRSGGPPIGIFPQRRGDGARPA
jgi:hypothetical protein